jgi:hypothetical protein
VSVRGYFVQYRFILPDSIKHSSYTYQKLFRAIYGYTQSVYKSNGKTYKYHRKGILSDYPYIRPGKNCVIIPPGAFQKLQDFFKTGHNPTHNWNIKGDWKCTYFLNEKDLDEKQIIKALEDQLSRKFVEGNEGLTKLTTEIKRAAENELNDNYSNSLLNEAKNIVETDWFKEVYSGSSSLNEFYQNYKKLKE